MPEGVSAIVALANTTITGSSTTSVTFSSISSSYRDLLLVVSGTNSVDTNLVIRFNGDTSSNYAGVVIYGTGTAASTVWNSSTGLNFNTATRFGTGPAVFAFNIFDYTQTNKSKHVSVIADRHDTNTARWIMRWNSTTAITSVTALVTGGNMVADTTLTLYGVSA